jgi:hypothetical protein
MPFGNIGMQHVCIGEIKNGHKIFFGKTKPKNDHNRLRYR